MAGHEPSRGASEQTKSGQHQKRLKETIGKMIHRFQVEAKYDLNVQGRDRRREEPCVKQDNRGPDWSRELDVTEDDDGEDDGVGECVDELLRWWNVPDFAVMTSQPDTEVGRRVRYQDTHPERDADD